jgi:hypothetical protein
MESGLNISGSAKGAASITMGNGNSVLLFGMNSGNMQAYQLMDNGDARVSLNSDDAFAIIKTKDGKQRKLEFAYGDGYLGNSSRTLKFNTKETQEIQVTNFKGETRTLNLGDVL